MKLSTEQKRIIESVVNVFETGSARGDYSAVSVFADGPAGQKQVTYGRSQTTEHSGLKDLLVLYEQKNGVYAAELNGYILKIRAGVLSSDTEFHRILRAAGKDPAMQACQDELFDKRFFSPAMKWADDNLFFLPLSALVIYDSFIHSGSVPQWLRRRFPEAIPANGGDEKSWIVSYVDTRKYWLQTAANPVLHNTVYRMDTMKKLIKEGNWELKPPILAHGVVVT